MAILYHYLSCLNFLSLTLQMPWTPYCQSETSLWVISFILKISLLSTTDGFYIYDSISQLSICTWVYIRHHRFNRSKMELTPCLEWNFHLGIFFVNKWMDHLNSSLIFPSLEIESLPLLHCHSLAPLLFNQSPGCMDPTCVTFAFLLPEFLAVFLA